VNLFCLRERQKESSSSSRSVLLSITHFSNNHHLSYCIQQEKLEVTPFEHIIFS